MTGTMIFVEEPDIDKIRNLKRIIDASAYGTVSILRYTFQILEQSPAAGIPILAAPPFLLDLPWSDSTLIHKVLVKWSIDGAPVEVSRTVETRMPTAEEVGSATGGARKNVKRTRRHRHLNRRQFRKTRTG